jgi:hypothetical protein
MIPENLRALFWDVDPDSFEPQAWPDYTIFRVLEYGDEQAVEWMRQQFAGAEIQRVLRSERRLSAKSANFWALVYGVAPSEVAALSTMR